MPIPPIASVINKLYLCAKPYLGCHVRMFLFMCSTERSWASTLYQCCSLESQRWKETVSPLQVFPLYCGVIGIWSNPYKTVWQVPQWSLHPGQSGNSHRESFSDEMCKLWAFSLWARLGMLSFRTTKDEARGVLFRCGRNCRPHRDCRVVDLTEEFS